MLPPAPECRYCGNDHDVRDLCRARRVSRRIFVFTASAAAVGACLPASASPMVGGLCRCATCLRSPAYVAFLALRDAEIRAAVMYPTWALVRARNGTWIATGRP